MKYSMAIAEGIQNYLVEDDWRFKFDEENGIFKFGLSLKGKLNKVDYVIDVESDDYIVYVASPIGAGRDDPAQLAAMAEFVCRANYGLKNGNFELDFRDGEIRYKIFVPCEGLTPSRNQVKRSIYCAAAMFDRYGDGILKVLFSGASAEEAVKACEEDDGVRADVLRKLSELLESEDVTSLMAALESGDAEGDEAEKEALKAKFMESLGEILAEMPDEATDDEA